ncbi:MAG: aspartyl-tRNA(Asn)/glutamyl-tRNA(Gln) amidotransferase subunit [Patescibacteria group bacterium]|nr:aspartyl-tRNA(Asn)/glutamyl-tRNA(Gln) amidotransferase subunit [Patescibacteria group bacterium]
MADLSNLSIQKTHYLLTSKETSCVELVKYYFDRISKYDGHLQTVIILNTDNALEQARNVDEKIAKGENIGLMEGIPYVAKDMFLTEGVQTTAASQILKDFIPPYSATVIDKLNKAGSILLAKVNQDEFAHGGSTENSSYHKTFNPWDVERVPGGSSGGSAAAVAADFCVFALGTDTGGSIRQPSAYCGVSGMKPTYGLVSRYGVVAMASSFDCVGPIAKDAKDVSIVMDVIAGRDSKDSTTIELDDYNFTNEINLETTRVGYLKSYEELLSDSIQNISSSVGSVESIPDSDFIDPIMALAAYYILVPSEISSNLERYDGIRYGQVTSEAKDIDQIYSKTRDEFLGPEVKRRILMGTYALSAGYYDAYYKKAMRVRKSIINTFDNLFSKYDAIITPTTVDPAFVLGEKSDPISMYKTDLLTVGANLAGIPAISIPTSTVDNLPMGLQIMSAQTKDSLVLSVASQYQQNTSWHKKIEEINL